MQPLCICYSTTSTSESNTVGLLPLELPRQPTSAQKRRLGEPKANLRCEGLPKPKIWPSDEDQRWRPLRWLEKTKCLVCPRMIAYQAKDPNRTGIHEPPARLTNMNRSSCQWCKMRPTKSATEGPRCSQLMPRRQEVPAKF